ncbi:MAG: response regulator [Myxococcaceae bacterium]|nr:response regulator [Myxococcaceae bacterium]
MQIRLTLPISDATQAQDGNEALKLLARVPTPPSMIMLDLMMTTMNGWQFLEQRSKTPAVAAIPVVVMTAIADVMVDRFDVMRVLEKPVRYEALQELVEVTDR